MNTILQTEKLSKSYPMGKAEQPILYDIDLTVERGEFVAVMGASGSGKSTLLYNVSGMDRPTAGAVELMGRRLNELSEPELARLRLTSIGYIFQQSNLLRNLNLYDNIVLPAYRAKQESRQVVDNRADMLMARLEVKELADKDIAQASGGQLQRVAICRALINNPEILFGDEPTGALNSSTTAEVMDILTDINNNGTTILLVTHDVKVAARASRVLYMRDGRIVGETKLGIHAVDAHTIRQREDGLSAWLHALGF